MQNFIKLLDGKKTYISALLGVGIGLAYLFDYITLEQFQALIAVAGSFGLIGVRDAMRKFER